MFITNSSTGATTYDWDFCSGDLAKTPTASVLLNSAQSRASFKVAMVESNGSYYGFYTSRADGNLYRLDFGSDVKSTPTTTNLGALGMGGALLTVQIVKENNIYYGFVVEFSGQLYRFRIGASVTGAPDPAQLIYTNLPSQIDLAIVNDGTERYAFVAKFNSNQLTRIKFPNSFADIPSSLIGDNITVTGSGSLSGVSFLKECNSWYAVTTAVVGGKLTKIFFGAGLSDASPIISDFTSGLGITVSSPAGISLVVEGGAYYAFIQAQQTTSKLYRINFGNSLSNPNPTGEDLTDLGILSDVFGFAMYKFQSDWLVLANENGGNRIFKITFPDNCIFTEKTSTNTNPSINVMAAGTQKISLRAIDAQGKYSYQSNTVMAAALTSPDISFTTTNVCVNHNVLFTPANTSGNISAYQWDFGDGQTSSQQTPSNIYASVAPFTSQLKVTATNGCENYFQKKMTLYQEPITDFSLPAVPTICTNQSYLFSNTTVADTASHPTWEWRLNGTLVAATKDLTQAFANAVPQELRLKAVIPGCQNEMIKTISTVKAGPVVSFSASDNCQGSSVAFVNTTSNADAGYSWTFDDGSTSTLQSPSHTYLTPNTFQVKLSASNTAGCQNFLTKPIKIYSLPQPVFTVGLPPFSCNNSATPFQNTTAALTDSNITGWSWQFGEPGGSSVLQQPSYTYASAGNYNVVLTATTSKNCTASVTKSIVISASSTADFTAGPSCANQSTKFTDASIGTITARNWTIGTSNFTTTNPSYTFTAAGSFPTSLSVTSPNGCISVKTKSIVVPVVPVQNFSLNNPCAGKNAVFTDATTSPTDVIAAWAWNFDGNSTTGNPTQFRFDGPGTFNTKLTTTHASGCKYTLSKNVVINPSPVASFTPSPDRGAAPLTVQFLNTTQLATTYAWKFNDKVPATSTRVSPVYTFTSLGDYSAELTATNAQGCYDVITVPIFVLIPSIDLVLKDFLLVSDAATGKDKAQVTIFNNSNVPIVSAEVAVFLSDKAVVNETVSLNLSPGKTITTALSFTVSPAQFDYSFLCAEINSEKDIRPDNNKRCINLEHADHFLSPYPNPSSGMLRVDWIAENSGNAHLVVFDSMGKKAYEWETPAQVGLNQSVLDLTFLTCGMYYLTIETSGARKTTRFVRQ